jgi:exopolysaccharide biosynthesis polyprenyl glycosylphosphotransferase
VFQERVRTLQGFSVTLDVACLCVAFASALLLRIYHVTIPLLHRVPSIPWQHEHVVPSSYAVLLGVSVVAWVFSMRWVGLYQFDKSRSVSWVVFALLRSGCLAVLATGAAVFVLKMHTISRLFVVYYFGISSLVLAGKQTGLLWLYRSLRRSAASRSHALVIGAGRPASWFAKVLLDAAEHGYQLVGLLLTKKVVSAESFAIPVVGTIEDLDQILVDHPVDEVFIVGSAAEIVGLASVAEELLKRGRIVSLVSTPATAAQGVRGRVTEFSGVPMISFGPMPRDEVTLGTKRVVDVLISAVALAVLSPVMFVVALAIKLSDPGPMFFAHERLGTGGRRFKLYKFRSMRTDAEEVLRLNPLLYRRYIENDFKLPEDDDPRISLLGRFLRKTSLDELPQLWNVLRGDMTLVGPRPIVPAEIEKYEPYADLFLSVRPGITGHWQVSGRSDVQYPDRAFMDLDYICSRSVVSDLGIMFRTVPAVLRRKGAY